MWIAVFQACYTTVFGIYSAFLFLRTGWCGYGVQFNQPFLKLFHAARLCALDFFVGRDSEL